MFFHVAIAADHEKLNQHKGAKSICIPSDYGKNTDYQRINSTYLLPREEIQTSRKLLWPVRQNRDSGQWGNHFGIYSFSNYNNLWTYFKAATAHFISTRFEPTQSLKFALWVWKSFYAKFRVKFEAKIVEFRSLKLQKGTLSGKVFWIVSHSILKLDYYHDKKTDGKYFEGDVKVLFQLAPYVISQ